MSQEVVLVRGSEEPTSYYTVTTMPVKEVYGYNLPIKLDASTRVICGKLLNHWKSIGCVAIYGKEGLIETISVAHNFPKERAEKEVATLLEKELLKEEDEMLIPQSSLLACATAEEVKPGIPWCVVNTYSKTTISLHKSSAPTRA